MDCPFSAARLNELRWVDGWRIDQIAALAQAATGEIVNEALVREWFAAAGVAAEKPPPAEKPARAPRAPRRPRAARVAAEPLHLICSYCDKPFEREAHRGVPEGDAYCCNKHHNLHVQEQARTRKAEIRRFAPKVDLAIKAGYTPAEKACDDCGETRPAEAYSVDVYRGDGRARICLECNRRKSREYYRRNQERLQLKARERKRAARSAST